MSDLREAAQQALEALAFSCPAPRLMSKHTAAEAALRAALAQEEQEPVAMCRTWHKGSDQHAELLDWTDALETFPDGEHSLYSAPPRREWQSLSEEEIDAIDKSLPRGMLLAAGKKEFARAIEAKLKEKNNE